MFRKNFENAVGTYEATGTRLEDEFIGTINGRKYKEQAYAFLHKEEMNMDGLSEQEKIERSIKIKEEAAASFTEISDFKESYIKRSDAMRLVENCQIGNPENPSRFFAHQLYSAVQEKFSEKDFKIKFFTAMGGTHLDVLHKIDCFFKLYIRETDKEVACATLDLTQNDSKDGASADVLVKIKRDDRDLYDPSRNNDMYDAKFAQEKIEKIAEQVKDALVENYRQRIQK